MVIAEHSWRHVAAVDEVPTDTPLEIAVGNTAFILVRLDDGIAAYQGNCPHQAARLGGGKIQDGWLRCPHHMAQFRMSDGACGKGWALPTLRRYTTRIEDGGVFLSDPPRLMDPTGGASEH